jgi:hypothetical protein
VAVPQGHVALEAAAQPTGSGRPSSSVACRASARCLRSGLSTPINRTLRPSRRWNVSPSATRLTTHGFAEWAGRSAPDRSAR